MARHPGPVELEAPHPSASCERRFPDDVRLRKAGFKIHSRLKGMEAVWEFASLLYTQTEALALLEELRRA